MYQIGIVAKQGKRLVQIQAELNSNFAVQPNVYMSAQDLVDALEVKDIDGVVIGFDMFGVPQARLIQKIHSLYPKMPILAICEVIGPSAHKLMRSLSDKIVVKDMNEVEEIPGVIHRMILGEAVCPRAYRRYSALQGVSLGKSDDDKSCCSGRMFNISRGGARVRSFSCDFKIGDQVKLVVPGLVTGVVRQVVSEVVWVKDESPSNTGVRSQILGLQFVS